MRSYNKDLYEQYDLEVPDTWEDFLKNCDTLKEAGETAVIGSLGDSWTIQVPYLGDHYNVLAAEPDFSEKFELARQNTLQQRLVLQASRNLLIFRITSMMTTQQLHMQMHAINL